VRTFRAVLFAATAGLVALTVGLIGAAPAGAGLTSAPTVGATAWTDAGAPAGTGVSGLSAVSCSSASFCTAVGEQMQATGGALLIEMWNGSSWGVVTGVTGPLSSSNTLEGVSCVGPAFCLAVGSVFPGVAFAERWNGSAWSQVTVAIPPGVASAGLNSVSCVSTTLCEVLGSAFTGSTPSIFGGQWNGTSISLTPAATPSPAISSAELEATGMDCVSATWCIAVGGTNFGSPSSSPFAELWNGSSWSLSNVVVPGGVTGSYLRSVSCAGPSFCQAVGRLNNVRNQNLIESWNGTQWTLTPNTPQTSTSLSQGLSGVDCFSATTCTAVGAASATSGPSPATLVLQWNGTAWSIVSNTPNKGTISTQLLGVSCVTNWACVAVGNYGVTSTPPSAAVIMTAPIARSGYRFVASDGGVFNYGSGAPFLGSLGNLTLNAPIVGMAVTPAGDGYYLVASDGGVFAFGSAQFYGSTGNLHLNKPVVGMAVTPDGAGYWLVASDGGIFSYGDAQFYGSTGNLTLNKPVVGMGATPDGRGYYLVASDGGVFSYGDAQFYGSTGNLTLNKPVVGMAVTLSGGYYFVATDGGVFNYGPGAPFLGSMGGTPLNKPVVGMTAVAGGYYLSASDGGVFTFPPGGVPPFLGSTGNITLNKPIVGIAG
jgi:hypothetical protein